MCVHDSRAPALQFGPIFGATSLHEKILSPSSRVYVMLLSSVQASYSFDVHGNNFMQII